MTSRSPCALTGISCSSEAATAPNSVAGQPLHGDDRGLVQARLHRHDGRDRHPVAVRQVQSERQCDGTGDDDGAKHREHDQRPGQLPPRGVTGEFRDRLGPVLAPADQPPDERHRDPQRRPADPGEHLSPGVAGDVGGMMEAGRDREGDDEPDVEEIGRDEPVHPERDRQAGHQRDRSSREHQPAPGVSADAEPQPGQRRADQHEDGDMPRAVPVAAARVGPAA